MPRHQKSLVEYFAAAAAANSTARSKDAARSNSPGQRRKAQLRKSEDLVGLNDAGEDSDFASRRVKRRRSVQRSESPIEKPTCHTPPQKKPARQGAESGGVEVTESGFADSLFSPSPRAVREAEGSLKENGAPGKHRFPMFSDSLSIGPSQETAAVNGGSELPTPVPVPKKIGGGMYDECTPAATAGQSFGLASLSQQSDFSESWRTPIPMGVVGGGASGVLNTATGATAAGAASQEKESGHGPSQFTASLSQEAASGHLSAPPSKQRRVDETQERGRRISTPTQQRPTHEAATLTVEKGESPPPSAFSLKSEKSKVSEILKRDTTGSTTKTAPSLNLTGAAVRNLFALSVMTAGSRSGNKKGSADLADPLYDPSVLNKDTLVLGSGVSSSIRFVFAANAWDQIEALKAGGVGSQKKKVMILANLFRTFIWWSPGDLTSLLYLCINRVAPEYEGLEIGIGEALIIKLMTDVYGRSEKAVRADLNKCEDLGQVALMSRCTMRQIMKPVNLTVRSVFTTLKAITLVSGKQSQDRKKDLVKKLLAAAEGNEAKYVVRFLQQRSRTGVQGPSIYQALAEAFVLTPSKAEFRCSDIRRAEKNPIVSSAKLEAALLAMEVAVKDALNEVSNIDMVVKHLLEGCGPEEMRERCSITPGVPVQPMLAKPTKGLEEVMKRLGGSDFTCEYKYDGERAQIHLLPNKKVSVFSRNLESLTAKYPDILAIVNEAFKKETEECILDSEVVAFDPKTNKILPFQILATRRRKKVEVADIGVQVCIYVFDCLQRNGQSLLRTPLIDRRKVLAETLNEIPGRIVFAQHLETSVVDEIDGFMQEAIEASCEGLMVKSLKHSASYEPSKRSLNWLKMKKDYLENLTDSVDLVPIGAYYGRGRRHKVYGVYLLACYDPDQEVYQTTCKVGTGFSDENLTGFFESMQEHITQTKHPRYQVDDKMKPDVWFNPVIVWEVRAADLSISPLHTAAAGLKHDTKGIGLRFPRFIRIREDKKPEQATTPTQIADMFENQFKGASQESKLDDLESEVTSEVSENEELLAS